jgi:UbiD family decarboxylase
VADTLREVNVLAGYPDLRTHLDRLDQAGLLMRVTRPVNKDTEIHPLVRLQFRGGLPEDQRKAWLFENVVDSTGRHYDMPVVVGALAASPAVYAVGLGCSVDEVADRWDRAMSERIPPIIVDSGPVQEVVHEGADLLAEGGGLEALPIPISTPGFDNAPYTTCSHWFTKDPDTGIRNAGNYRGQVKARDRLGCYMALRQDGAEHWRRAHARGERLPAALVIGAPPVVSYAAVTKLPFGVDEMDVAGALAGEPIRLVKCKTVDIEVPAEAEIVVEGYIRTDVLEPEGPFGESHGYVHPRGMSPFFEVSCITHRRDAILTSFISQVTPSESSVIKKMSYVPTFLAHLRDTCRATAVTRVHLYEPLINLRKLVIIQLKAGTSAMEVSRVLLAATSFHPGVGKVVIAVDSDIDPESLEMVMWAVCFRSRPHRDIQIVGPMSKGHGPPFQDEDFGGGDFVEDSHMLINAMRREDMPPISLPKKEFMDNALNLWKELGLPDFVPTAPWFGYSLGQWSDELDEEAALAVAGRCFETGEKQAQQRTSS